MILIPLVGLIISLVYLLGLKETYIPNTFLQIAHGILITAGLWLGCMAIVEFLWRKYPWEHHPKKHLFLEIIAIILYTMFFSGTLYWFEIKLNLHFLKDTNPFLDAVVTILITLFITSIHEAFFFYQQWKHNFSKSIKLEKDSLEARYEVLKTQINPHFLFNSLNSLISLVEENEKAVDYIQNLSEFLRYILKSSDRQVVLVREELETLQKYLHILKIRFDENIEIEIQIPEKYFHFSIPPLTLQMLVENCIKHNVISTEKHLKIHICTNNEGITVTNALQLKTGKSTTGQGLKNISERYRYFSSHEVKIKQTNHTFAVTVPLLLIDL